MQNKFNSRVDTNNLILKTSKRTHFFSAKDELPHVPYAGVIHNHDCISIEFLVAGKAINKMKNAEQELTPGSLLLLSQMDFHQIILTEPCHFMYLAFDEIVLSKNVCALWGIERPPLLAQFTGPNFTQMRSLFLELMREDTSQNKGRDEVISSLLSYVFIKILRAAPEESPAASRDAKVNDMLDLLSYIRCHFRERLTLEELSKVANLSPNYICRCFTKYVGTSFRYHIQTLRLNFAMSLVRMTDMTISEICHECGFESVSHFSQAFKEAYGESPSYFRKET